MLGEQHSQAEQAGREQVQYVEVAAKSFEGRLQALQAGKKLYRQASCDHKAPPLGFCSNSTASPEGCTHANLASVVQQGLLPHLAGVGAAKHGQLVHCPVTVVNVVGLVGAAHTDGAVALHVCELRLGELQAADSRDLSRSEGCIRQAGWSSPRARQRAAYCSPHFTATLLPHASVLAPSKPSACWQDRSWAGRQAATEEWPREAGWATCTHCNCRPDADKAAQADLLVQQTPEMTRVHPEARLQSRLRAANRGPAVLSGPTAQLTRAHGRSARCSPPAWRSGRWSEEAGKTGSRTSCSMRALGSAAGPRCDPSSLRPARGLGTPPRACRQAVGP